MKQILWTWFRRFILIAVPLTLVCLEWDHPSGFSKDVYKGLAPLGSWWKHLHITQSFLFGAVGVGGIILTLGLNDFWGTVSKISFWLFMVCYLVFDSTGGIAIGFLIEQGIHNSPFDLVTTKQLIQKLYNDPVIGGSNSLYSLTGSWAWLVAIVSAIIALGIDNRSLPVWKLLPPFALLAISAYSLYVGHYSPYGPIAFSCFAVASVWFEVFRFGPAKSHN